MPDLSEQELFAILREFDTPSITNVVATYPGTENCLGLYNPWTENWYTDTSIRCMYPELGPLVGYAVTCVFGLPDPNYSELSFLDVIDALDASKKPTVLVFEQKFPPEITSKAGLAGGNMTSAMKAVGCVGAISNGPSRDIDEIRPMKFQYLLSGITPGHGAMALRAINVPVSVAGMDVAPGELIHMDENGACKFPADSLEAVVKNVQALRDEEADRIGKLANATSAKQVRAIMSGHSYAENNEEKPTSSDVGHNTNMRRARIKNQHLFDKALEKFSADPALVTNGMIGATLESVGLKPNQHDRRIMNEMLKSAGLKP